MPWNPHNLTVHSGAVALVFPPDARARAR